MSEDEFTRLYKFMQTEFAAVRKDIADVKESFRHLNQTLDAFLKRLDDIEADNHARDAQIARLERWIEAVAQKTGVKLEY